MQISQQLLTASDRSSPSAFIPLDRQLRELMDRDIEESGLSREQVADRMSDNSGYRISIHQLNAWLAPNRQGSRLPCVFVPSFCEATGSDALKRLILGPQLCELLELGERAAAILDDRAQRILRVHGKKTHDEGRGNDSCAS